MQQSYKRIILPIAKVEWLIWYRKANNIINKQSSLFVANVLKQKILHPLGGSIYASYNVGCDEKKDIIKCIVAFQILADLLDSESERPGVSSKLVKKTHCLLLDFINGGLIVYEHYPPEKCFIVDINYLKKLVREGKNLLKLKNYSLIHPFLKRAVRIYAKAQFFSSMDARDRDISNRKWARLNSKNSGMKWFEFYASQASTLPIFALFFLGGVSDINRRDVDSTFRCHYSWISVFHIMFNHYQEIKEDTANGTINYASLYGDERMIRKKLMEVLVRAQNEFKGIKHRKFYLFILYTLAFSYAKTVNWVKMGQFAMWKIKLLNKE